MRTNTEYAGRQAGQRLADLRKKAAELERRLFDARAALEHELARFSPDPQTRHRPVQEALGADLDDWDPAGGWIPDIHADAAADFGDTGAPGFGDTGAPGFGDAAPDFHATRTPRNGHGRAKSGGEVPPPEARTASLVNHGRPGAADRAVSRWRMIAIGTAALAVTVTVLLLALPGSGPSWPPSVAVVQGEIATACQNPDVSSEPGQVNFACAKTTRQILWVFSLMTSSDNPDFTDAMTGRVGLEPIAPAQGGEVAWSLNLHHPYDPASPIDSLEVAARAINNIIGGATLTAANGRSVIQPGLESKPANCVRYTGSAAIMSRPGFPALCARPVAGRWGQVALVSDIFRKWVVGAPAAEAEDAAVLFENAQNPGNPRVQAILRQLQSSRS